MELIKRASQDCLEIIAEIFNKCLKYTNRAVKIALCLEPFLGHWLTQF